MRGSLSLDDEAVADDAQAQARAVEQGRNGILGREIAIQGRRALAPHKVGRRGDAATGGNRHRTERRRQ